ncbi:Response regulator receiver:transcriptional regulatory protein [Pseudomonas coronafaciens pv. coronafaciens]|nr:Transcriptional regulatory protein OmpR [Pseudomonas coronafaciens]RMM80388.1 Response regulator receiver:transcriptional regulatory protein [Pseudomonas coronafaciens pv. striafaciens]RMN27932.1 Response regulator receiver:transcriptional regulatory protein [Pseudomonas coronafaciens pv. zizaniae]RMP21539.1 Response regulator receiver:transcriptional regulatory protein [Pseudomonas coronafaciens pv. atropurpurea]RMS15717.1 Response regulator receiver:transcriptional regulatory protein [Pseu
MIFNGSHTMATQAGDRRTMQALPDNTLDATSTDQRWSVRALIVDDDVAIRELLCDYLTRFNINARGVTDGAQMRQALSDETFDVVVLDLMLPGEDGLSLCRWLRSTSDIPILMLTARCEPTDRIIGLELGADDYMAKPFEPRELVARIQTILRRVRDERSDQRTTIRFDAWRLNSVLRQLTAADGLVVPLSNAEFRLLRVFLERPHRVLSREQLLDAARGRSIEAFDRSIDLLVSRLRQKLGDDPKNPQLIKTVRGEGYLFDARELG